MRKVTAAGAQLLDEVDGSVVEPIGAVLARLGRVEVAVGSLAGCDGWLADAARVAGWLAATRVEVEAARQEQWWRERIEPEPDERDAETDDDGATRGGTPTDDAHRPQPEPEPSRVSARARARAAKLARLLSRFEAFRSLLRDGRVTEDHVLALDAVRNRGVALGRVDELVGAALEHTAEGFAAWLRTWDAEVDLGRDEDVAARQHRLRALHLFDRTREMGELRGSLPPAVFDALRRTLWSIDDELRRDGRGDPAATYQQRMADALVELMHRANDGGNREGSLRTAVVVLIDLEHLLAGTGHGTTVDGTPIDVGEVRRLAAREHVIPLVLGADSVPLDLGRAQRYASDAQWLALLARDGGCAGCDAPLGPLDAHHDPPWGEGGRSDLSAMKLLCRYRCHRTTHAAPVAPASTTGPTGHPPRAARPPGSRRATPSSAGYRRSNPS